jgi:hypothetical protein
MISAEVSPITHLVSLVSLDVSVVSFAVCSIASRCRYA